MLRRPRRLRNSVAIRSLVQENHLLTTDLVMPLFVVEGKNEKFPIKSMPGIFRLTKDLILEECKYLSKIGIKAIALFPVINPNLKNQTANEALNPDGIYPQTISLIKKNIPELIIITDVALDPYNSDGQDGLVEPKTKKILNDRSIEVLTEMALLHAQSGADFVAPSDMMDGRVEAIRKKLDKNNFEDVGIISYTAKYASSFYGPFREALDSAPSGGGDKKSYQMNPANSREALVEAELDTREGADILLVKPGLPYLDILSNLRKVTNLPLAVYNVSGEYALIKNAYEKSNLDYKNCVLEIMFSFKRSGADLIFTYHAKEVAEWLNQ